MDRRVGGLAGIRATKNIWIRKCVAVRANPRVSVPEEKVAECQPRRRKRVKTTLRDAAARCTKAEREPDSEPDFLVEYELYNSFGNSCKYKHVRSMIICSNIR